MVEAFRTLKTVFSAHAEVVLKSWLRSGAGMSILRARGGSSDLRISRSDLDQYSPRTRR